VTESRWTLLGAAAATAGVTLSAVVAARRAILITRWTLLVELALWSLVWAAAVVAALHLPRRRALVLIIGAGLALRLAALGGPPSTSDDLFRYSWDGRVQAASVDPYAYPPDSSHLAQLKESWLWPDAKGCAELQRSPGCTRINRPPARTIYPPVAEAWFAAVYRVAGIGSHHKAWQVAGLLTEAGVLVLLPVALRRHGKDPRWAALYALSPAPVLEIVNNGHVDGLAILLMVGAMAVLVPRTPWRDIVAGALIGAAAMVKVYPAILLVALVGEARAGRLPILLRAGGAAAALTVVGYFPHVLAVGTRVVGYLPGYLKEEHYRTGGRFLIASALRLPAHLAGPLSAVAVAGVAVWVLVRRPPVAVGGAALLGALLLATSPVQPWYAVGLLALAVVAARPRWVAVTVAGYPYFFAVILDYRHVIGLGQLCYVAALLVIMGATLRTRFVKKWPGRRRLSTATVLVNATHVRPLASRNVSSPLGVRRAGVEGSHGWS
jgi:hypothetical protein